MTVKRYSRIANFCLHFTLHVLSITLHIFVNYQSDSYGSGSELGCLDFECLLTFSFALTTCLIDTITTNLCYDFSHK